MSWLSRILYGNSRESPELVQAKQQEEISKERLQEVLNKRARVERVSRSLEHKKYRNGWGEAIAETMRRAAK